MLDFFYEKKDFYQLKEVEKLCHREKGITAMSVKEILQSLVDDDMVDTDKIGTCVYFWSFPSKASQKLKNKEQEISTKLADFTQRCASREAQLSEQRVGKEDSDERTNILQSLADAKSRKQELQVQLEKYKTCDPAVMKEMKKETEIAIEAVNRWTDNVFSCKSWIKKKFYFEDSVINKQFEIPEDFDYLE